MPRPKPTRPPVQFNAKLPQEEHEAIGRIVERWAAEVRASLAKQGIYTPPPADRTSWLRAKIREDAARYGVPIEEPAPSPAAAARAGGRGLDRVLGHEAPRWGEGEEWGKEPAAPAPAKGKRKRG